MNFAPVNLWAVLASSIAAMVIGSIWYGPLFGKKYMHLMGMDAWSAEKKAAMKKQMGVSYAAQFIASFVMFYILSGLTYSVHPGLNGGLAMGFALWLGFVVPIKLGDVLWGGKKELFWLGIGNMLITLLVAGAIIGNWR